MQLSAGAVELTDSGLAVFMGTLAAAQARPVDSRKRSTRPQPRAIFRVTGQTEVAVKNARLCSLYAAGRTVDGQAIPRRKLAHQPIPRIVISREDFSGARNWRGNCFKPRRFLSPTEFASIRAIRVSTSSV